MLKKEWIDSFCNVAKNYGNLKMNKKTFFLRIQNKNKFYIV